MQDEHNKLLFIWQKNQPNSAWTRGRMCQRWVLFYFQGAVPLTANAYKCVREYILHISIYIQYIYTHARAHTHGWCRPLQSHGAINSQIYKINRFSSNRSLLDVEVTHENKTDQNPDPADWTWAPPCSQQRPGGSSGPAPASYNPLLGEDSHP